MSRGPEKKVSGQLLAGFRALRGATDAGHFALDGAAHQVRGVLVAGHGCRLDGFPSLVSISTMRRSLVLTGRNDAGVDTTVSLRDVSDRQAE